MDIFKCSSCILFILLMANISFGQTNEIQVLLDSSRQVFHLREMADSLARLSYQRAVELDDYEGQFASVRTIGALYEYYYDFDSASIYFEEAMKLAQAQGNHSNLGEVLVDMAYLYEMMDQREHAISNMEKCLELYTLINDSSGLGLTYRSLGYFHNNGGDHEKSLFNNLKALEIAEAQKDQSGIARASQGIGIVYNKQKDFNKAEFYFLKAMSGFSNLKDTSGMLGIYNDFGILNKNRGNYEAARKEYFKMLEIGLNPNYEWVNLYAYNNLGILYYNEKQYSKGIEYCQKGARLAKLSEDKRSESDALNYLAKNQLALGLNPDAIINASRSLKLAEEAQVLEKERDALLTLSEAYENVGQIELALLNFKKHKLLYDSIYNEEKTEQIHSLEKKYETEKKNKEIALLGKNAEIQKVKNTRLGISLIATILIGTLVIWFQMLRRKKEKEVETEKRKVTELENQRLNQELDFKKQELTSKVLQLCHKNEFLQSINKQVNDLKTDLKGIEKNQIDKLSRQINQDMSVDNNWGQFLKAFESVHPDFAKWVFKKYPDFTTSEIRMACLLKMNLGTKEIANLLNISAEGVKKTRHRMRKKMAVNSNINLIEHFMNLEAVTI